jgi:hypothetical protein
VSEQIALEAAQRPSRRGVVGESREGSEIFFEHAGMRIVARQHSRDEFVEIQRA